MRNDSIYTFSELENLMKANMAKRDYLPPVRITSKLTDSYATIMVPIPGVHKEDVSVKLDGDTVIITIKDNDNAQFLDGWKKNARCWDGPNNDNSFGLRCGLKENLVVDFEKEFLLALENGVLVISVPLKSTKKEFVWA